jgi:hypothetical protein
MIIKDKLFAENLLKTTRQILFMTIAIEESLRTI